ncbi:hypothetical protein CH373_08940 [Leptospira perolatii]|uniref:Uncharacterized protein n=2 Tax=Leptospira perolatii TaxID=2023191 RepID=A0A2M9ZNF1_9LEPT|nr:hypothetical protein CH360_10085 [Leptospira perolatii]PJZ73608.1 hypothetical protein CH373_08940 [Leptospira perolatii]
MSKHFQTDLDKAESLRVEMVAQCSKSKEALEKLTYDKDDYGLKKAAIELFVFYEKSGNNAFKEMIELLKKGASITQADVARLNVIAKEIGEEEKGYDENFKKVQTAFASANGFPLEENKLQKEIDSLGK